MRCQGCGHENEVDARFCERCGAPLARGCSACGRSLSSAARFCRHCGAPQTGAAAPGDGPRERDRVDGERRQLTAMFCDIVDSTELAQRVDPEELRDTIGAYQAVCSEAIRRFDGHVAQYLGDGLLVYFGYPRAHEDDAERAVRAGLAIRAGLAELNQRRAEAGADPIESRVGIHTGPVIVVDMRNHEHRETLAVGETVNLAARIQAVAPPGSVLISQATRRLVADLFVSRDLGTPPFKGVSEPMRVYVVESSAGIGSRFRATDHLTPLKGRDRELAQLLDRWDHVKAGEGQVVAVSGQPGIGKSRLLYSFRERVADTPHFSLELACSPYTAGSAFQPLIELLQAGLRFSEDDSPEQQRDKLEERLAALSGLELESVVPYLAALLGLPPSERFPLEHMGPELQRERTLDALLAPIVALASGQPLLVVCEDLHWSDPSTLELMGRLIEAVPKLPMFLLLTFRVGFALPPHLARPHVGSIPLERLDRSDTCAVVAAAAGGGDRLPGGVLEQLAERADGVPLFAEELAKSVVESNLIVEREGSYALQGRVSDLRIPATLQDSLMARLDGLSEAKQLAQLGATLGRRFSYELIDAVAETGSTSLDSALAQLVRAGILTQGGVPPQATYTFKHVLLQDTAYESQLKSARRGLHARIAAILDERFPQRVAAEPEVMARHCAEAGLTLQAVDSYKRAGEQAVARLSNAEAVEYFGRALELHETLPESHDRNLSEIALRLALGGPLAALRGYEDPEALRSCERTALLCDTVGSGPQQLPALLGLMIYHMNRGHLPKAREYAEALLVVAEPLDMAPLRVAGHMIKGAACLTTATVSEACHHLQEAIEIARTAELKRPEAAFEMDALTVAYCTYGMGLVVAGKPESALQACEQGLRRARELAHPRTHGSALVNCAMAAHLLEEPERTGALAEEFMQVLAGRGFHTVECSARVLGGWARARLGDPQGIADLEAGLRLASERGSVGGLAQFLFAAVDVYARAGRFESAFEALDRGAAVVERTGEHVGFGPQLPALRARLLLESGSGSAEEASALLIQSIELSQRVDAPWLALGSAILLGRTAATTGKKDEARTRLAELYGSFSEGLETPRLREARELLDALA